MGYCALYSALQVIQSDLLELSSSKNHVLCKWLPFWDCFDGSAAAEPLGTGWLSRLGNAPWRNQLRRAELRRGNTNKKFSTIFPNVEEMHVPFLAVRAEPRRFCRLQSLSLGIYVTERAYRDLQAYQAILTIYTMITDESPWSFPELRSLTIEFIHGLSDWNLQEFLAANTPLYNALQGACQERGISFEISGF